MEKEYDFSPAKRGKFYREDAILQMPIHFDPQVLAYFRALAAERGIQVSELINAALKREVERIKASAP